MYTIQLFPKNANECLDVFGICNMAYFPIMHQAFLATVHFALCGTPRVGSSVLVRFQSG